MSVGPFGTVGTAVLAAIVIVLVEIAVLRFARKISRFVLALAAPMLGASAFALVLGTDIVIGQILAAVQQAETGSIMRAVGRYLENAFLSGVLVLFFVSFSCKVWLLREIVHHQSIENAAADVSFGDRVPAAPVPFVIRKAQRYVPRIGGWFAARFWRHQARTQLRNMLYRAARSGRADSPHDSITTSSRQVTTFGVCATALAVLWISAFHGNVLRIEFIAANAVFAFLFGEFVTVADYRRSWGVSPPRWVEFQTRAALVALLLVLPYLAFRTSAQTGLASIGLGVSLLVFVGLFMITSDRRLLGRLKPEISRFVNE